jgi:cysteine-rich repeat protein
MTHPLPAARRLLALAPLALLLAGPAFAQSSDDVLCIETINKGLAKTALAENKALAGCARDFSRGLLSQTVVQCAAPENSDKVGKAVVKWTGKADQKCGGVPPPFGPPSVSAHPGLAIQASAAILSDIFGTPVDDALQSDDVVAKCQQTVIKLVQKCEHARLGEFNGCKRGGLRGGSINNETQLSNICLGTGQLQPDSKGKINTQCILKAANKIESKCVSKGVGLGAAFPGCGASTGTALTVCVDGRIRCRTCELLNAADGLARDCDLMDDGNDGNGSCDEPTACGDGQVDGAETCDDGDQTPGDGCGATCQVEAGFMCTGEPSVCGPLCGDGVIAAPETCDDGDASSGDGCSATCQTESGYQCLGAPSLCATTCGDGVIAGAEVCDDGDALPGDGCGATCQVEAGFSCNGQPSVCTAGCGDGVIAGAETCDDGGTVSGDGCSSTCQIQAGYQCSGQPSSCSAICGDGLRVGGEPCDDGGTAPGDGCSATCTIEAGFQCSGQPSTCVAVCGDSLVRGTEGCDDGGTTSGNGCSSTCQVEPGYFCSGEPSVCTQSCGNGIVEGGEPCDDGNGSSSDGCSASCQIESGYQCTGQPSVCTTTCGDGIRAGSEGCDDGGTTSGNGCSATCQVESGYQCSGQPSTCLAVCGDGLLRAAEQCDDGNTTPGDGCTASCQIQAGYQCSGQPSVCNGVCGDGIRVGSEGCDDGGTTSGNGCSATCTVESGYQCSGQPSTCTPVCGDGLVRPGEQCDDGGTTSGNGCSSTCTVETGFNCSGQPSSCTAICGDGLIRGSEACDDGGTSSGNGCSATCTIESGYNCTGQPSSCVAVCGDGLIRGAEQCDDGGTTSGNGCSSTCQTEAGFQCTGQPSSCTGICGDGLIRGAEQCDDDDTDPGDGCSGTCQIEFGYACSGQPSDCDPFGVIITSPANGIFTTSSSTTVSGIVFEIPPAQAQLRINGVLTPIAGNGTFSRSVSLSSSAIFNPIRATVTDTITGDTAHDRIVVIRGSSVADGALSEESVGLRLNDSGLDEIEPLVGELAGEGLDLAALLPVGTVLINNECFIEVGACLGRGTVTVINPPPSIAAFGLTMNSQNNFVEGDITVNSIAVHVHLSGSGLVPSCDIHMSAAGAVFAGDYALQPQPGAPTQIDVNQIGNIDVTFNGFTVQYDDICDEPIIGDIIQAFIPDVEELTIDAMAEFLDDPDGSGPLDSPTADGIETALEGIEITGPISSGLGVMLEAPLFAVTENTAGITLGSDSKFTRSIGMGPGQCIPPAGAPNLTASYAINEVFPNFTANTPVGGVPYDMGLSISTEGFNQLLKAQTECGLLVTAITELDVGAGPTPLTADLLTLLMPEFAIFPPLTLFRIEIQPTLAPIVTSAAGPSGELGELKIAQVLVSVVRDDNEQVVLVGAFDADIGFDMEFVSGGLGFVLSEPLPGDITVAILDNPLGVDEATLENVILPPLISLLLPDLAGSLASFPIPSFLDLELEGIEVSRTGTFLSLYADLEPAP